jgi:peptidoglycan hydrolase-like protein with peptidoglycan-binding domain
MRAASCLGLCLLALACGHTHVVSDAPPATATAPTPATAPAAAAAPPPHPHRAIVASEPGAPPLFASPAAALAPGGVEKLQARLVATGDLASDDATGHLDEATERAVREFQRAHHLPATGVTDDATAHALGLRSEDVFRRTPVKPTDRAEASP